MEQPTKTIVKFLDNDSTRWDGKITEVSSETVNKTGKRGTDGLEQVEVHWPGKGKGKVKMKVWKAVLIPEDFEDQEEDSVNVPAKRKKLEKSQTAQDMPSSQN